MKPLDKVLLERARSLREDVQRQASGERLLNHVPTGFSALDDTYGGLRIGICTELMAHTGDGKSTFARQVAEAAARAGAGVLWFVGEDPEDATAERQLADTAGLDTAKVGRLDLTDAELALLDKAAKDSGSWARRVALDFSTTSVDEVFAVIDETPTVAGVPLKLIIVDYAQLFGEGQSLEGEIARLARGLNQRAGDRHVAVLLLSQVANTVISRGRERYYATRDISGFCPGLGDTEWSRRTEKATKTVLSLFRDASWRREMGEDVPDDHAELHVKKANFGPKGWVPLGWDGPRARFYNL